MKTPNGALECQIIDAVILNVKNRKDSWSVDGDHVNQMIWTNTDDGIVISTSPKMVDREGNSSVKYPNPHNKKCFDLEVEIDSRNHKFSEDNATNFFNQLFGMMNPVDENMSSMLSQLADIHNRGINGDKQGSEVTKKELETILAEHVTSKKNTDNEATTQTLTDELYGSCRFIWR